MDCVIKIIKKDQHSFIKKLAQDEITVLENISHYRIVRLYEIFEDAENYYIVSEYLPQGNLYKKLLERGEFCEQEAKSVVRKVVEAVRYLHGKNIIHRDIKPENILVVDNTLEVKLADMGFATFVGDQYYLNQRMGSPYYMSPEMV